MALVLAVVWLALDCPFVNPLRSISRVHRALGFLGGRARPRWDEAGPRNCFRFFAPSSRSLQLAVSRSRDFGG